MAASQASTDAGLLVAVDPQRVADRVADVVLGDVKPELAHLFGDAGAVSRTLRHNGARTGLARVNGSATVLRAWSLTPLTAQLGRSPTTAITWSAHRSTGSSS